MIRRYWRPLLAGAEARLDLSQCRMSDCRFARWQFATHCYEHCIRGGLVASTVIVHYVEGRGMLKVGPDMRQM